MNIIKIFLLLLLLPTIGLSQTKIHWLSLEEALAQSKINKKKIVIDVYTNSCSDCAKMQNSTLQSDAVAQIINEKFYPVKLNAEQKDAIIFKGKTYKYIRQGKKHFHEFVGFLLGSEFNFPTLVFLDENFNIIQAISGFKNPKELTLMAKYFGNDYHKKMPWVTYKRKNR